ncbi:MAG: ATP-binding protein [Kiritimatiellae bacterium]|jgi:MinD superfamily P-loop ATPase|nr:ATP-binding protein [Kiritimatiellia bacterium]
MNEIVVISGKGGTGKTSVTASLAALADNLVISDCDVDAADLHLLLAPQVKERHDFYSGREAIVNSEKCNGCGICAEYCRFDAFNITISADGTRKYAVDPVSCEGCGVCVAFCPVKAIDFPDRLCGEWMLSETRFGPMVHAKLGVASENSGKLVSTVRDESKKLALKNGMNLVVVDGPPGIGCPVIASLTGATQVLVVTEPTVSGEHDLERVLKLTVHFKIPASICVNKWDLNVEMTERIEKLAASMGSPSAGRIRYDKGVTTAQINGLSVVETDSPSSQDVKEVCQYLLGNME